METFREAQMRHVNHVVFHSSSDEKKKHLMEMHSMTIQDNNK